MRIVLAVLFTPFLALCAYAQSDVPVVMRTFTVVSQFSLPPWSAHDNIGETSKIFRDQGKSESGNDYFIHEMIPSDESFDAWTRLYAITAETPISGDLQAYANGQVNVYVRHCTNAASHFFPNIPEHAKLFLTFCEGYKNNPTVGEISVFNMQIKNETLVKNYITVRVPAFKLSDGALPLNDADFQTYVDLVWGLRLIDDSPGG